MGASCGLPAELSLTDHTLYFHAKVAFIVTYLVKFKASSSKPNVI